MPSALTIFAAQRLIFIEAALAALVVLVLLYRRPRTEALCWIVTVCLLLVLSEVFARIGGVVYNDPRPFAVDPHLHPLIAHARDNGFPSDHALLAAAVVAAVGLADLLWAIPFVVLAVLVDWARVGAGIHHVSDVVGSSVFVAVATVVALVLARLIVPRLLPYVPAGWLESGRANARPVSSPR